MRKVENDKLLHATACALVIVACARWFPLWAGVLAAAIIAAGKELYDKFSGGVPSWADLLADAAGIVAGVLICLI